MVIAGAVLVCEFVTVPLFLHCNSVEVVVRCILCGNFLRSVGSGSVGFVAMALCLWSIAGSAVCGLLTTEDLSTGSHFRLYRPLSIFMVHRCAIL